MERNSWLALRCDCGTVGDLPSEIRLLYGVSVLALAERARVEVIENVSKMLTRSARTCF